MSLKKRTTKKSQSRSKSSQKWLKDHFDDVYVKQAQKAGYRSRAVYKLLEIQEKDHILKHGMTVVDLGAGDGFFLKNIDVKRRIAVDIGDHVLYCDRFVASVSVFISRDNMK